MVELPLSRWLFRLAPLVLPAIWLAQARGLALGRRTGDLVSHVWAVWNGLQGDPTRSALVGFPAGVDLLTIYGGWLHTFVGVLLARAGLSPVLAYSAALALMLAGTGLGAYVLARSVGLGRPAAALAALLLELDGWVLYNAMDGRPEHAGFGPLCLALAGAVVTARGDGPRWAPVATGLAGALVFVVGWEQALWLFLAMLWLLPALVGGAPDRRGAVRRLGLAAGVALLAAAPWVGLFFSRALGARHLSEGAAMLGYARDQSLVLEQWAVGFGRQPARAGLLLLLASPILVPRGERGRALWLLVGLGLSLVLALGPAPGLRRVGDLGLTGPYAWMQVTPVLGWFHSPARLAMGLSFASTLAAAFAVERLAGWLRARGAPRTAGIAGALVGLGLLGASGWELAQARDWPRGGFSLPERPEVTAVGERPGAGVVVDLPVSRQGVHAQDNQLNQLLHQRPIPGHAWLPWLASDRTADALALAPLLRWASDSTTLEAPPFSEADRQALLAAGYRFIGLTPRYLGRDRAAAVSEAMQEALGPPMTGRSARWLCWDLEGVRLRPADQGAAQ